DEIIRRRLDIGWDIRARVDCVDAPMLERLRRAHCERIHYGVEAGTEKILAVLNKGITLDQVRETFAATKKLGIETLGYFMIGAPSETRDDIMRTIDFALSLRADFVHITILCPFPNTEIYARGLSQGIFPRDYWREFARDPRPGFTPPFWNENFSDEELQELLRYAYRKFYTRPSYILNKLSEVRSWGEFRRKARAGLKIFGMKSR
nr:radical SAM protein [bacterium]